MDATEELGQCLKSAGVHPSQIDPVVLHERGDIFPHLEAPKSLVHFVTGKPDPEIRTSGLILQLPDCDLVSGWLGKVVARTMEERLRD